MDIVYLLGVLFVTMVVIFHILVLFVILSLILCFIILLFIVSLLSIIIMLPIILILFIIIMMIFLFISTKSNILVPPINRPLFFLFPKLNSHPFNNLSHLLIVFPQPMVKSRLRILQQRLNSF